MFWERGNVTGTRRCASAAAGPRATVSNAGRLHGLELPSHFRRRAVSQAPKRVQSGVEALLIVGLVSLLLAKIATSSTAVGHARASLHRPSPEPSRAPF